MPLLTATVEAILPEPLLVNVQRRPGNRPRDLRKLENFPQFQLRIDGWDVELMFIPSSSLVHREFKSGVVTVACKEVAIFVSRNAGDLVSGQEREMAVAPDILDLIEIRGEYLKIAVRTLDRLFQYFRFQKLHPLLPKAMDLLDQVGFANPTWTGDDGQLVAFREYVFQGSKATAIDSEPLGTTAYSAQDQEGLIASIEHPEPIELERELLLEALDAISRSDVRHAVLDLAMCCEVAVKTALFSDSTVGGRAVSHLESKGKLRAGVLELLEAAEAALGRAYDRNLKKHIEDLFSCRDSVVHHGRTEFGKRGEDRPSPEKKEIRLWWSATRELLDWLREGSR
jgi:hypothetical protein